MQQVLVASGLPPLLHRMSPRQRVTVLMYHAVLSSPLAVPDWSFLDERAFRAQLEYVARRFEVVTLSQATRSLRQRGVHRPTAVITFDDGFQSVYEVALPVLKRMGLPATVFLVTGMVGTDDTPWFCRLNRALAAATRRSIVWRDETFPLHDALARARAGAVLQSRLKELPHPLLMHELAALVGALGDDARRPVPPTSPYRMLGPREVDAMAAGGIIDFGAHTQSHAILSLLTPDEQAAEVEGSVRDVARLTGGSCRLFSYPDGRAGDYDGEVKRTLTGAGVEAAVTGISGSNRPTTPRLELRRVGVGSDMDLAEFRLMVHDALPWPGRRAGMA